MEHAALIGLPGAGTSTLFDALVGGAGSHGHAKGGVRRGDIKVPDPRIDHLSKVFKPRKTTYADLVASDVGGFEPDGKALNKQLMNVLQSADALVAVVRAFSTYGAPTPVADLKHILDALKLADFVVVEQRAERLRKQAAKGREAELIKMFQACLEEDNPLSAVELSEQDRGHLSGYGFLSLKPVITVLNTGDEGVDAGVRDQVATLAAPFGGRTLTINASTEREIAELPPEDQAAFLAEMGIERPARDELLRAVYEIMDLIPFFTTGEDEVRAWTIRRGTPAVRAAGKIHSDLERGFIRAEVIGYDEFVACNCSFSVAKERGALRLEGKEYVVRDGDIINVRFSV